LFPPDTITLNADMTDKQDVEALLKESKAEYRQLGKSGLRVSVPIFGCMSFGDKKWQPWVIEEEETLPLLKAAYDRGLTTWDTGAPFVCSGQQ
jgi:predicted aldo/keto reductase-like oxidoreductase